jgi:hypothetical protein
MTCNLEKQMSLDEKIAQIDQRYIRGWITLRQALRLMRRAWLRQDISIKWSRTAKPVRGKINFEAIRRNIMKRFPKTIAYLAR